MSHIPISRAAGLAVLVLALIAAGGIPATADPTSQPAAASPASSPGPTVTSSAFTSPAGIVPTATATSTAGNQVVIGPNDIWTYYYGEDYDRGYWFFADKHGVDTTKYQYGAQPIGYGSTFNKTELAAPAAGPRPRTVYFRKSFWSPSDLWAWKELRLTFIADDGVAVHLNGSELTRVNLPEGKLTGTTYATAAPRTAQARAKPSTVTVPIGDLTAWEQENTLGVEVHPNYRSSPDMSFQLTAELIPNPQRIVIPTGDIWRYRYQAGEPPASWKTDCNLDDSSRWWRAPLGFGAPAVRTELDVQPISARPLTAYFCSYYYLGDDPDAFGDLEITTWANDGMVIYVDGKEVKRINMPAGKVTSTTYATAAPSAAVAAKNPVTFTVPRSAFGNDNRRFRVAAEVHLNWRGTRDMVFDLTARSLGGK